MMSDVFRDETIVRNIADYLRLLSTDKMKIARDIGTLYLYAQLPVPPDLFVLAYEELNKLLKYKEKEKEEYERWSAIGPRGKHYKEKEKKI